MDEIPLYNLVMVIDDTYRDVFYLNDLAEQISLNGLWSITLADHDHQEVTVPSVWEATVRDYVTDGPAIYRRHFRIPPEWLGETVVLQAHAISFSATIRINGALVGKHNGMWAPFQFDVSRYLKAGDNVLEIEVWKPGLRYPVRQCLAGFLPDVATTFGGIWQSIVLTKVTGVCAYDVHITTNTDSLICVTGRVDTKGDIIDLNGTISGVVNNERFSSPLKFQKETDGIHFRGDLHLSRQPLWEIGVQNLLIPIAIHIHAAIPDTDIQITRKISFRSISADGERMLFNHEPVHLRGVLDWGWDPLQICPTPSREQVVTQIEKARALGFNMLKLCLFVPDEVTFEVSDEYGMPIWLELPMWLPDATPDMQALALREFDAILSRLHHHPSIVIVSLGCELQNNVSAEFLSDLGSIVTRWMPNVLRCDNSGSAEAYGGVSTSASDFYDYHFYTDPHHFQGMVAHFDRPYQKAKPWIYGEFCDADTTRDFAILKPDTWWLTDPLPLDRDELTWTRDYQSRLSRAGITDNGAALLALAVRQTTAVRKHILEQVRCWHATGGYVVTGWSDTPISTSGIVDDNGKLKYDPVDWQQFNNDTVLLLDRERRRYWKGGDRPMRSDPCCYWQGDTPKFHLLISNGRGAILSAQIKVEAISHDQHQHITVVNSTTAPGSVSEVAVFGLPNHTDNQIPAAITLHASASLVYTDQPDDHIENSWRLLAVPSMDSCLQQIAGAVIHHQLTRDLLSSVRDGSTLCFWLDDPDSPLVREMPFWREAIHVLSQHKFWETVPHPGYADMRFFSVATDHAIDQHALRSMIGDDCEIIPIWRRFDARRLTFNDYVLEVRLGNGRMYLSTLRHSGGLGIQPDRLEDNPMGAWLLKTLLDLCTI